VHKVEEVDVIWILAEVFSNHLEDGAFEKEGIIHGHEANAFYAVPARLPTTGNTRVHDVV
jgi:hypothetical protein